MDLARLEDCNKENLQLLKRYEMIMRNRGITEESIKAMCKIDIPLFLRYIKDVDLNKITNMDVEDFLFYCQDERKNQPQSSNRKYASLNSFFKQLIRKDLLDMKNPLDKIDKAKERVKLREPLTCDDVHKIFSYIDEINDLRSGAIFSLFLGSGVRLSELWQLNRDSLDFEKKQFSVLGKGQKMRRCIFDTNAKERILKYLESRTDDSNALFYSRNHNRLSKKAIQELINKICVQCGISIKVFPHRLRHTAGHVARENGVKIEDIQVFLGHGDPGVTASIYARGDVTKIQNQFMDMYNEDKTETDIKKE